MPSKAQCDRYAEELNRRFDDFVQWAISNWPRKEFPLMRSDFDASRRELGQILGPKLGEADLDDEEDEQRPERGAQAEPDAGFEPPVGPGRKGPGEYRDMNPMPWP